MKKPREGSRKKVQCGISKRTCMLLQSSLPILELEDVQRFCFAVGDSCFRHGCEDAGEECRLASEAKTETEFLKHCKVASDFCNVHMRNEMQEHKKAVLRAVSPQENPLTA